MEGLPDLERIFEALREERDPEDVLAQWTERQDAPDFVYDAVRMLLRDHPNSPHVTALRDAFSTADDIIRNTLIIWDDDLGIDRDTRLAYLRGFGRDMSPETVNGYAQRFPWDMVANRGLTQARRLLAAEDALSDPGAPDDPAARDAHLLTCFTAKEFNEHARFYAAFRKGGWEPTLPKRLHLVERGHISMVKLMAEELRAKNPLTADDVAVIEALREKLRDTTDLVERARDAARGGGHLSLVHDPEAAGGLTQAAEAGGLEVKEE